MVDRSGGVLVDFKLTKANLELRVLLSVPPKCCDYRHVPPLLAQGKNILRFTLLSFICACVSATSMRELWRPQGIGFLELSCTNF